MHVGKPKGLPKTGGRQKGSKNKRTKNVVAAVEAAHELAAQVLPNGFDGDAHTLLILTYRDVRHPIETRLDAAKAAIGFEKPRLAATDHTSNGETLETVFTGVPRAADLIDPAKTKNH